MTINNSKSSNAQLLLWASASFVLVISSMLAAAFVYQARSGSSSEPATQAEIDLTQPWYTLLGYILLVPMILGATASIGLTRAAPRPRLAPVVTMLWVVVVIACIAYAITWHSSMHFSEAAHSDSTAALAAQWLVRSGVMPFACIATGVLAYQLGARLIVGVCAVILVAFVILGVLGIGLPPAVLVVAWIPLGVRTMRADRKSSLALVPIAS
jgi:hypothetical protein